MYFVYFAYILWGKYQACDKISLLNEMTLPTPVIQNLNCKSMQGGNVNIWPLPTL